MQWNRIFINKITIHSFHLKKIILQEENGYLMVMFFLCHFVCTHVLHWIYSSYFVETHRLLLKCVIISISLYQLVLRDQFVHILMVLLDRFLQFFDTFFFAAYFHASRKMLWLVNVATARENRLADSVSIEHVI